MDNRYFFSVTLVAVLSIMIMGQASFREQRENVLLKLSKATNLDPTPVRSSLTNQAEKPKQGAQKAFLVGQYCFNDGVNTSDWKFSDNQSLEIKIFPTFYTFKRADYATNFKGHYIKNKKGFFLTHQHISSFNHEEIIPVFFNGSHVRSFFYRQNLYSQKDCPKEKGYYEVEGQYFEN